ncbi:MAG: aminotransferase class I/II-fold pyridoxal phosphate-dependent enzyme [Candidatus Latescibacterota bacterium]
MPALSRRTATFTESVIRRMTRVADAHGAINLSQGFPDFDPPAPLLAALRATALAGPHQYAVTWGAPNFRQALAAKLTRWTGIVYAPCRHLYMAALPGMFPRTLTCSSLSKTYSITGWRLGYVAAAPEVVEAVRKVHDFLTVGAAAPLQEAAVTALGLPDAYYAELLAGYTRRRDVFLAELDRAGLCYTTPQGAYYVLVDVAEFGVADDVAFCEWLARDVGVAAVPGSSFFREPVQHLIRFHFAKTEATLLAAGERLDRLRERWHRGR